MAAQNSCLEIERKFLVPEDFSQIFQENGFNFVKEFEEVLSDTYFDTQDHHLLHMVQFSMHQDYFFIILNCVAVVFKVENFKRLSQKL